MSPPPPSPLLNHLRNASREFHRRLDTVPLLTALLDPALTPGRYAHCLHGLHAAHTAMEQALLDGLARHPGLFDFLPRRKAHLLAADLADLGVTPGTVPLREFPALEDIPSLVGTLYVVEGATLGGQLIARHLSQRLGLDRHHGARFFNAYGDAVAERWGEFVHWAEQHLDETTLPVAAAATRATFEWLRAALEAAGPLRQDDGPSP